MLTETEKAIRINSIKSFHQKEMDRITVRQTGGIYRFLVKIPFRSGNNRMIGLFKEEIEHAMEGGIVFLELVNLDYIPSGPIRMLHRIPETIDFDDCTYIGEGRYNYPVDLLKVVKVYRSPSNDEYQINKDMKPVKIPPTSTLLQIIEMAKDGYSVGFYYKQFIDKMILRVLHMPSERRFEMEIGVVEFEEALPHALLAADESIKEWMRQHGYPEKW